ncbi:unnamed protein product [Linum trigynum]|uniref:Secreted protein n=1 Tax=Linum trigynum TaxID=586398 RepID=A0AAV2FL65_9ROSI
MDRFLGPLSTAACRTGIAGPGLQLLCVCVLAYRAASRFPINEATNPPFFQFPSFQLERKGQPPYRSNSTTKPNLTTNCNVTTVADEELCMVFVSRSRRHKYWCLTVK